MKNQINLTDSLKKVVRQEFTEALAEKIINLKIAKDFKHDLIESFCNDFTSRVVRDALGLPKSKSGISLEQRSIINTILQDKAFCITDFGRKKNTYHGDNLPFEIKEGELFTTTSFRYVGSYSGYMGYEYRSHYALLFHRLKPILLYRLPNMKKPARIKFTKLQSEFAGLEFARILNSYYKIGNLTRVSDIKFRLPIIWNETEECHEFNGHEFHVSHLYVKDVEGFKKNLYEQIVRRNKYLKQKLKSLNNLDKVFVTYTDSINAGNCQTETDKMLKRISKLDDERIIRDKDNNVVSVRADYLLTLRNDSYVFNTIKRAKERIETN